MDLLLTYEYIAAVRADHVYDIIEKPELLPDIFDHITRVEQASTDRTLYTEYTRSVLGFAQQIHLRISREPGSRIVMASDHWLLQMGMDIHITPLSPTSSRVVWQVRSRKAPAGLSLLLRFIFGRWYQSKLAKAMARIEQLALLRAARAV